MRFFKLFLTLILISVSSLLFAQKIKGVVYEVDENKKEVPLFATAIYWQDTQIGTTSEQDGSFEIDRVESTNNLIFRFIGFKADTVSVNSDTKSLKVVLQPGGTLKEVLIEIEQSSSYLDYMETRHVEIISEKELAKAACCNLSESFETNPSVDVSFADAVTGTRQIQMLGLAGKYSLITRENMPNVRGLISNYGLTFTPGTWIQSIQVTKGIGSVTNGYESITGQINVELKKPYDGDDEQEKFYANVYGNMSGRTEFNMNYGIKVSDKFSNTTLIHASARPTKIDNNGDGFMDNPLGSQLNLVHRWKYFGGNGHMAQLGVNALVDNKQGGQMNFNPDKDKFTTNSYGLGIDSKRFEVWGKTGYVFPDKPYKSVGFQTSTSFYDNASFFGLNSYVSNQFTQYNNLLYQTIIGNTAHQIKSGVSTVIDYYDENYNGISCKREEIVPGAFTEYTYAPKESFSMVLGARADYHNIIGLMFNPRLHAKYHPTENSTIRVTSGKGQRIANVFAENTSVFISSRNVIFDNATGDSRLYGLKPEEAWNNGLSFTQDFKVDFHKGSFTFDFYRTDFVNQVITDLYQNQSEIHFYNLDGKSFSNSAQVEVKYSPFKRADLKTAYRYYDVKATYDDQLVNVPFISQQRAFVNFSYKTRNNWMWDITTLWTGAKRIPFKGNVPLINGDPPVSEVYLISHSPDFITINTQISKSWNDGKFNIYFGAENLTNFRQSNPIFDSNNPFGNDFDASMVWGPIFGRNIYAGLKFKI